MNYLIATAITAFLALPQVSYPQQGQVLALADANPPIAQKADIPDVLERIAECESRSRQFNDNGKVLRGEYNKHDIGKYQINDLYWGDLADELGLDIHTEEGNEALALAIYEKQGTAPWNWSKKCWNK